MTISKPKALLAALVLASPMMMPAPASAQARGVGVVSIDRAIQQTTAYQTAVTQIRTTYATQIAAYQARATALQAELQPLQTAFETAQAAAGATEESVRPSYEALQTRQQAAQQELATLQRPFGLATEYAREQIAVRLSEAMTAAMTATNVDLLLNPQAVLSMAQNSPADITAAVTTQLNSRVPSVQITPPTGWNPGDTLRAAQAAQQQQTTTEGR